MTAMINNQQTKNANRFQIDINLHLHTYYQNEYRNISHFRERIGATQFFC